MTGFHFRSNHRIKSTEGGAYGAALCVVPFTLLILLTLFPLVWNPFGGASLSEIPKWTWLAFTVTIGLVVTARWKNSVPIPRSIKVLGSIWLLTGLLSVLFSQAPLTSWYGSYQGQNGYITSLLLAVTFVVLYRFFTQPKNQHLFLYGVEMAGALCAFYALWQSTQMDFSSPLSDGRVFAGRVYAFFSHPNDFGQYLLFPLFASVTLLTQSITGTTARITSQWKRKLPLITLHGTALLLLTTVLFLTLNRASMLGAAVGIVLFIVLTLWRLGSKLTLLAGGISILIAVLFSLVLAAGNLEIRSWESRQVLWKSALELAGQSPFFGFGQAVFPQAIQSTLSPDIYEFEPLMALPNRVHNGVLEIFLEQGALGLAVVMLLFFVVMKHGFLLLRIQQFGNMAVYALSTLVAVIVSLQFGYAQITTSFFIVASLALITAGWTAGIKNSKVSRPKTWLNRAVFCAIMMLTLGLLWHGIRIVQFDLLLGEGMKAALLQPQAVHNPLGKLLLENPPFAYPYEVTFTLLQEFEPSLEQYGEITGHSYQYYAYQGMFAYLRNDVETARQQYKKALEMAPNSMRVITGWALAADKAGDTESFEMLQEKFEERLPSFIREDTGQEQLLKKREIFFKSNPVYFDMKEAEQE